MPLRQFPRQAVGRRPIPFCSAVMTFLLWFIKCDGRLLNVFRSVHVLRIFERLMLFCLWNECARIAHDWREPFLLLLQYDSRLSALNLKPAKTCPPFLFWAFAFYDTYKQHEKLSCILDQRLSLSEKRRPDYRVPRISLQTPHLSAFFLVVRPSRNYQVVITHAGFQLNFFHKVRPAFSNSNST